MKKMAVIVLAFAVLAASSTAFAQSCNYSLNDSSKWDDMSWWGNTPGTEKPVKDRTRSGYWWWPKDPGDTELWGNRGVVYSTAYGAAPVEPPRDDRGVRIPVPADKPEPPPVVEVQRKIPVYGDFLFNFDKFDLSEQGQKVTNRVVRDMKKYTKDKLVIVGHTCNVGSDDYNLDLGKRRAQAVKGYMVEKGVAGNRISAVSKGETEPAVPNDTPSNRKLNRRVVFNLKLGKE